MGHIRKLKCSLHLYDRGMLQICFFPPDLLPGKICTYLAQRLSLLVSVRLPGVWTQGARWEAVSEDRWHWTRWWPHPAGSPPLPVSLWSALWECWLGTGTNAYVPGLRHSMHWFPRDRCEFLFQNEVGPSQTICMGGESALVTEQARSSLSSCQAAAHCTVSQELR